ncbi:MAG: hypothetical protein QF744_00085 [SAR202 cluster bacterium]|nr:hypothetical protein [SAR202 cluster bacterium]
MKEDGYFFKKDDQEQVWDSASASAMPADGSAAEAALEGAFTVDGVTVRPAFQVFKDHVARYPADWASGECGLPVEDIEAVARELGENAMIGSTIMIDGVEVPHRPVAIMAYHVSQQELGFQAVRAMNMLMMLLGAFGAAGGQQIDFTWKIHGNYEKLDEIEIAESSNVYLAKTSSTRSTATTRR